MASARADRLRGRLMAESLGQLLDRVRGARDVLPHLAALERALLDEGAEVVGRIPPQGLARMCSQLSSLPLPAEDPPLHELLTRLMDAYEGRPSRPPPPPPPPVIFDHDDRPFDMERTVVIEEGSHTDFMVLTRAEMPTELDDGRALDDPPREGGR